jgi:hypothetical protein
LEREEAEAIKMKSKISAAKENYQSAKLNENTTRNEKAKEFEHNDSIRKLVAEAEMNCSEARKEIEKHQIQLQKFKDDVSASREKQKASDVNFLALANQLEESIKKASEAKQAMGAALEGGNKVTIYKSKIIFSIFECKIVSAKRKGIVFKEAEG